MAPDEYKKLMALCYAVDEEGITKEEKERRFDELDYYIYELHSALPKGRCRCKNCPDHGKAHL